VPLRASRHESLFAHERREQRVRHARRRTPLAIGCIERFPRAHHGSGGDPTQRLRFPIPESWTDEWQADAFGVAFKNQIRERPTSEVRRRYAFADLATAPGEARRAIEADAGLPVTRNAEHSAPSMGDAMLFQDREERLEHRLHAAEYCFVGRQANVNAGPEGVPAAARVVRARCRARG